MAFDCLGGLIFLLFTSGVSSIPVYFLTGRVNDSDARVLFWQLIVDSLKLLPSNRSVRWLLVYTWQCYSSTPLHLVNSLCPWHQIFDSERAQKNLTHWFPSACLNSSFVFSLGFNCCFTLIVYERCLKSISVQLAILFWYNQVIHFIACIHNLLNLLLRRVWEQNFFIGVNYSDWKQNMYAKFRVRVNAKICVFYANFESRTQKWQTACVLGTQVS